MLTHSSQVYSVTDLGLYDSQPKHEKVGCVEWQECPLGGMVALTMMQMAVGQGDNEVARALGWWQWPTTVSVSARLLLELQQLCLILILTRDKTTPSRRMLPLLSLLMAQITAVY